MENKEIRKTVYHHYEHGFHCAEVIAKTLLERFSSEPHPEAIKIASGFGGGIAGSTQHLCGALTGGVIVLSSLFGRQNPTEGLKLFATTTNEFKKQFLDAFGALDCHAILEKSDPKQNPYGCVKLTAQAAVILSDLIDDLATQRMIDPNTLRAQPSEQIGLGQCPFGGCSC
ncbi:MAG: C-GCAxxG-C-C family protein [Desulfatitalea sp.]